MYFIGSESVRTIQRVTRQEESMRRIAALSLFVVALAAALFAETHLSGDIKTAAIDSTGNPYIVDQDIVVPAGKKVTIKEGCIFLFKGFTGLNVSGQINVAGSAKHPVVFTSVNDGDYNPKSDQLPNPFDWNGMLIAKESGGALLEDFSLRYSVYGVKSQTANVSIRGGVFRQNGQFHFTINEKIQYVQDNIAYSYTATPGEPERAGTTVAGEGSAKPSQQQSKKSEKGRVIFRYTSLGVGVVGIAAGSLMLLPWSDAKKQIDMPDSVFGMKHPANADTLWRQYTASVNGWGAGSIISYFLGLLGLIGFGVSFAF
jgi:hypothetical protein